MVVWMVDRCQITNKLIGSDDWKIAPVCNCCNCIHFFKQLREDNSYVKYFGDKNRG